MPDEITPALTPDQWQGVYQAAINDGGGGVWASAREWRILSIGVDISLQEFGDDPSRRLLAVVGGVAELDPPEMHALAALALHEQPYGFTHRDVTILRNIACLGLDDWEREALDSIVARIEALLPHP